MSLTAIILTYNEELHLERCLLSLTGVSEDIVVVDSFSSDHTQRIALKYGCRFYQHEFITHSDQLNWALNNIPIKSHWVMRVDADEFLSSELISNLLGIDMDNIHKRFTGISVNRLMYFMGKGLRKGGMYPIRHLRIWRNGMAFCEKRLMDEHMILKSGKIMHISGDLIDHNLNDITWWINKHNSYATREAVDIVLKKLLDGADKNERFKTSESVKTRRAFKKMYLSLPLIWRVFILYFIRLIIQGAIFEGVRGLVWTTIQGLWYRLLVDLKVKEFDSIDHLDLNVFRDYILFKYHIDINNYIDN